MGNICSYFSFCIDDFDKEVIEKSENIHIKIDHKQNIDTNEKCIGHLRYALNIHKCGV